MCCLFRWYGADVNWNGQTPFVWEPPPFSSFPTLTDGTSSTMQQERTHTLLYSLFHHSLTLHAVICVIVGDLVLNEEVWNGAKHIAWLTFLLLLVNYYQSLEGLMCCHWRNNKTVGFDFQVAPILCNARAKEYSSGWGLCRGNRAARFRPAVLPKHEVFSIREVQLRFPQAEALGWCGIMLSK